MLRRRPRGGAKNKLASTAFCYTARRVTLTRHEACSPHLPLAGRTCRPYVTNVPMHIYESAQDIHLLYLKSGPRSARRRAAFGATQRFAGMWRSVYRSLAVYIKVSGGAWFSTARTL